MLSGSLPEDWMDGENSRRKKKKHRRKQREEGVSVTHSMSVFIHEYKLTNHGASGPVARMVLKREEQS